MSLYLKQTKLPPISQTMGRNDDVNNLQLVPHKISSTSYQLSGDEVKVLYLCVFNHPKTKILTCVKNPLSL